MVQLLCTDISSADENIYKLLYELASPERKEKADRYRWPEDKLRCVTAEALLRTSLGTADFKIQQGIFGKPCVAGREDFHYNISHSGHYVVIAWGSTEVGVDVQKHDTTANISKIAKRYFGAEEQAYMAEDPFRFYEIWTKKESYLKFTGKGLQEDLRSFNVLAPAAGIRYFYRILEGGYSLSLCTTEDTYSLKILDVQQLL